MTAHPHRENPSASEWTWYHIIMTTYGSWLYGDARGFRTRQHREHVEGDYQNPPPPGKYAAKEVASRQSLSGDPVRLAVEMRSVVGHAVIARLESLGAQVIAMAMGRQHAHVLAKMPRGAAREWTGLAKLHAWHVARDRGWERKLWGKRSKAVPIKTRGHQLRVFHYILRHASEGAWVWSIRDGKNNDAAPPDSGSA